ncbi:MAG TPA: ABC transporter ATP-binding protein [Stellaceae bacterium]
MVQAGILRAFRVYLRAFREVRPFWPSLALILGLGLAWIPISLLAPLPLKMLIDNVLGHQPLAGIAARLAPDALAADHAGLLALAIGLSVGLALIAIVHRLGDWLLREMIADRMVHGFRGGLLLHGLRLPVLHHTAHGTLDLGYRINQDAPALQWTAIYGVMPVIISLTTIACTLYVTAAISAKLALIALVTSLPMIGLVHFYQHRLKAKWHAAKEQDSAAQSIVHEVLGALRVVTLFGQERRETERFLARSRLSIAARLHAMRTEGLLGALLSLSTALGTAAILYLGVRDVETHAMSVGDLLVVITYIGQLYGPLQAIGTHVTGQQHAVASIERAFAVLDQPLAIADRPDAPPRQRARGEIAFRQVSFSYDDRNPVLRNATFTIPAGASVGIVGRTGAGKTTLVNLLVRLFDPERGHILLDGADLRDWRLADLRRQFAVVPQDPTLFSTTIAENIGYARPEATPAEIVAAAKQANAHDFIMALPQGYDTPVGERGLRLSGGERQRIALARAFLADAPLIILDEPTSAIDQHTEAAIIESIERLRRGRTTLVIAHRLATLRHVDIRLRVEDGIVAVEQDLLAAELRKVS